MRIYYLCTQNTFALIMFLQKRRLKQTQSEFPRNKRFHLS